MTHTFNSVDSLQFQLEFQQAGMPRLIVLFEESFRTCMCVISPVIYTHIFVWKNAVHESQTYFSWFYFQYTQMFSKFLFYTFLNNICSWHVYVHVCCQCICIYIYMYVCIITSTIYFLSAISVLVSMKYSNMTDHYLWKRAALPIAANNCHSMVHTHVLGNSDY